MRCQDRRISYVSEVPHCRRSECHGQRRNIRDWDDYSASYTPAICGGIILDACGHRSQSGSQPTNNLAYIAQIAQQLLAKPQAIH